MPYRARPPGSHSKLNTYLDGILVLKTIFSIIKDYKPLTFFSTISFLCFLLSVGFGSIVINDYVHTQHVYHFSTAVLATGLMVIALLSFATGLILDCQKRLYTEFFVLILNQNAKQAEKVAVPLIQPRVGTKGLE